MLPPFFKERVHLPGAVTASTEAPDKFTSADTTGRGES
jgi:hypothetical protein